VHATTVRWFLIFCWAALTANASIGAAEPVPQSPAQPPAKIEQVVVVFKTHFDIGYTQLAREVVDRYRTSMIDKALAVCDATDKLPPENRFVWTIPGWPMQQILWPGQTPERRKRIEKAIRDGRLVWHALGGTTHTESLGLEDFVRSLGFSSRLARQYGQPLPRDAKMTDVPCHTWLVPTVLKRAGIDFLHLGCNSASGSPDVPALFWWEGPDGSRLLTMYTAEGYGTGLKPPANWPHKTWLALIHTGDNHGPPEPGEVQQLLDRARKELPGVKIRMGRLSDFGDAILAEERVKPTLPVIRKDMPDTWIHGIMSMPEEAAVARDARPKIAALDSLSTLLACLGVKVPSDSRDDTETETVADIVPWAYERSFLYSEHTWGASSRYYSPRVYGEKWKTARAAGKYRYAEESWREHGEYIARVGEEIWFPLERQMLALARAVNVKGPRIVVFNPLPWTRDAVIFIPIMHATFPTAWQDAASGEPITAVSRDGIGVDAVVAGIPPLGYRVYVPRSSETKKKRAEEGAISDTLENKFFRVRLDLSRGVVRSLVDKRSGRELVDQGSEYGFGEYLYERFDKNYHDKFLDDYCKKPLPGWADEFGRAGLPPASEIGYMAVAGGDFGLNPSGSCIRETSSTLLMRRLSTFIEPKQQLPHGTDISVTLGRDQPFLDLECAISEKAPDPWPEAAWLCLPFAIDQPQFRLGRVGSIIDPAKDCVRGANNEMFCLDTGLTITGRDRRGIGICPIHSPLVSLGRPGAFRFTPEWTPRKPIVFVNLFNNIWGTNFQQWIGGVSWCAVRIWSVTGKGPEADLVTPAWEARTPCEAAFFDGPPGKLPPIQSGLELSRKGVLVTAFGPNPDGEGTLLRLWEQAGQDGPCRVRLPEALRDAKAQPCDLRGRPIGDPLPVRDGSVEVLLGRFAPASILLTK